MSIWRRLAELGLSFGQVLRVIQIHEDSAARRPAEVYVITNDDGRRIILRLVAIGIWVENQPEPPSTPPPPHLRPHP